MEKPCTFYNHVVFYYFCANNKIDIPLPIQLKRHRKKKTETVPQTNWVENPIRYMWNDLEI